MPELLAEFSSSAYLTDTQLSRFKRIPVIFCTAWRRSAARRPRHLWWRAGARDRRHSGCRWRTRVAKPCARSMASATAGDCACSWVSCWASAAALFVSRRSTNQVARRGVKGWHAGLGYGRQGLPCAAVSWRQALGVAELGGHRLRRHHSRPHSHAGGGRETVASRCSTPH